ncbi:MAG: uL15 family ribosomal protein [Nanoarchaeota archaeon]|nr:uL15 family ribosomal protein [Nanoarchaeota archaeon]
MIKRKKNNRQRGSHTHGWGAKKKHRGAGNRGGRGNAGSGKRGDAKKPSFWKDMSYYKSKGFVSLRKPLVKINISDLKKFEDIKIDLKERGFDKLLANGTPDKKYELIISHASKSAISKIEKAGGKILGLVEQKQKIKKEVSIKKSKVSEEESELEDTQETEILEQ